MKIANMSVELVDHMGSDLSVVNAARVSFSKESDWEIISPDGTYPVFPGDPMDLVLKQQDQKLISYLATHGHWSPFAHAFVTLRIKAPIFVARQLVKHQVGLSWNEESRRYIDEEPECYLPTALRGRPDNVKQGSGESLGNSSDIIQFISEQTSSAIDAYNVLLKAGVAPEQARMVLPLNTMTNWIWSGSLMAFARVCKQRLDPHAQLECQEVAQQINNCIEPLYPHSWKALLE